MIELVDSLRDELGAITAPTFKVSHCRTTVVPSDEDSQITFANLKTKDMKCKRIDTCVLYVDIRESTQLNLDHRLDTIAKLYSFFGRAMTQCGSHFGGQVRAITGDRVMVVFPPLNCFENAVHTAVLINSVSQFVMNEHFPYDNVRCGIGIDYGPMLVVRF
ncbi:MAG: hypothetical protein Q7T82_09245 [Armatimonadota bacterium]|nr:hypothetical protein [Armatimonadota bacterium]